MIEITLEKERLQLWPERVIYWPKRSILFVADIHLGKVDHFRKAGIAVPSKAGWQNFHVLQELLLSIEPDRMVILGDLFHSRLNRDWQRLGEFIDAFPEVDFELIMGNHDILSPASYQAHRLTVYPERLDIGPFALTHHPAEVSDMYNLCGHIHPCVRIRGRSRQSLRLPCFYFGERGGILPSFGSFTGMHPIESRDGDQIYAIADDEVIKIGQ